MIHRLYKSLTGYVHHRFAFPILLLATFIEAVIFVPVGSLLTVFCLERPEKSLRYALGTTIASVLGGAFAYWLGALLFCSIGASFIDNLSPHGTLHRLMCLYQTYGSYTVFIASLTPFPYKLLTLSAGFCHVAFAPFMTGVLFGRAIRFFTIALLARRFGPQVQLVLNSYFNYILALLATLFIASCFLLH